MKSRYRRLVLMTVTVIVGFLLILSDQSLIVVIAGTVFAGCIALLATGGVRLSALRRSSRAKKKAPKEGKDTGKDAPPVKDKGPGIFGGLKAALKKDISLTRKSGAEKAAKLEKIDKKLKETIQENVGGEPVEAPASKADAGEAPEAAAEPEPPEPDDPLAAFSFDELEDEDFGDILVDEDEVGAGPSAGFHDTAPSLSAEDASAVAGILEAHGDDLEDAGEMPVLTDVDEGESVLDTLDMGDLDIEDDFDNIVIDEGEEEKETSEPAPAEVPVKGEVLAEGDEGEEEELEGEPDLVSFAEGFVEDDMISLIKGEVGKKKVKVDEGLLRELVNVKIEVNELAEDMENLLSVWGAEG